MFQLGKFQARIFFHFKGFRENKIPCGLGNTYKSEWRSLCFFIFPPTKCLSSRHANIYPVDKNQLAHRHILLNYLAVIVVPRSTLMKSEAINSLSGFVACIVLPFTCFHQVQATYTLACFHFSFFKSKLLIPRHRL